MRPYLIFAPAYQGNSGGIRALHNLGQELRWRGHEVWMSAPGNPHGVQYVTTIEQHERLRREAVTLYPEIITDNPCEASNVVRWLLNKRDLPDMKFQWWRGSEHPRLTVNIIEQELFQPSKATRAGVAFWVGKGRVGPLTEGAIQITHDWPCTRAELAQLLGSIEYLVSFDPFSAINQEAVNCGTPVVLHECGKWSRDEVEKIMSTNGIGWGIGELDKARMTVADAWDDYEKEKLGFSAMIDGFIDLTQRAFST